MKRKIPSRKIICLILAGAIATQASADIFNKMRDLCTKNKAITIGGITAPTSYAIVRGGQSLIRFVRNIFKKPLPEPTFFEKVKALLTNKKNILIGMGATGTGLLVAILHYLFGNSGNNNINARGNGPQQGPRPPQQRQNIQGVDASVQVPQIVVNARPVEQDPNIVEVAEAGIQTDSLGSSTMASSALADQEEALRQAQDDREEEEEEEGCNQPSDTGIQTEKYVQVADADVQVRPDVQDASEQAGVNHLVYRETLLSDDLSSDSLTDLEEEEEEVLDAQLVDIGIQTQAEHMAVNDEISEQSDEDMDAIIEKYSDEHEDEIQKELEQYFRYTPDSDSECISDSDSEEEEDDVFFDMPGASEEEVGPDLEFVADADQIMAKLLHEEQLDDLKKRNAPENSHISYSNEEFEQYLKKIESDVKKSDREFEEFFSEAKNQQTLAKLDDLRDYHSNVLDSDSEEEEDDDDDKFFDAEEIELKNPQTHKPQSFAEAARRASSLAQPTPQIREKPRRQATRTQTRKHSPRNSERNFGRPENKNRRRALQKENRNRGARHQDNISDDEDDGNQSDYYQSLNPQRRSSRNPKIARAKKRKRNILTLDEIEKARKEEEKRRAMLTKRDTDRAALQKRLSDLRKRVRREETLHPLNPDSEEEEEEDDLSAPSAALWTGCASATRNREEASEKRKQEEFKSIMSQTTKRNQEKTELRFQEEDEKDEREFERESASARRMCDEARLIAIETIRRETEQRDLFKEQELALHQRTDSELNRDRPLLADIETFDRSKLKDARARALRPRPEAQESKPREMEMLQKNIRNFHNRMSESQLKESLVDSTWKDDAPIEEAAVKDSLQDSESSDDEDSFQGEEQGEVELD